MTKKAARYGMRRALETFGCDIAEAESAETARASMSERRFDLLLLDVNLPGLSGLEFLKEIQEQSEHQKTEAPLVVIVTAHGSERLPVQAVKSGAYDYISKPFELDDLRLVVKNAVEKYSASPREPFAPSSDRNRNVAAWRVCSATPNRCRRFAR